MQDLTPREVALNIIDVVSRDDKEMAVDWLNQHFKRFSTPGRDRALITELVYGTLRRTITLDWIISRYAFHRVKDQLLRAILRLGVYQIYFLDKVPVYAAVDEMVKITKERMGPSKGSFVNAILRRAGKRDVSFSEEALRKLPKMCGDLGILSIAHAMPLWLLERWQRHYNKEQIRQICEASNATPAVFVRVNTCKTTSEELLKVLELDDVQTEPVREDGMMKISCTRPLESLSAFRRGLFFVQDPMTVRVVDFMRIRKGDKILDMCAAPGGKAFAMEGKVEDGKNITALEKNPTRLERALENARRLDSKVRWENADALRYETTEKFDKILLDAPCSNQGVLARRVEARSRISADGIKKLQRTQGELLRKAVHCVSHQGAVYYSTCSIDPAENEELIEGFIKGHRGWTCEAKQTLLPVAGKHDGGFVAKLVRTRDRHHG